MFNFIREVKIRLNSVAESIFNLERSVLGKMSDSEAKIEEIKVLHESLNSKIEKTDDIVRAVQGRIEFVREELLFEMRAKDNSFKDRAERKIESKVLSDKKFSEDGIRKINIGCGHIQPVGYINVDARELPGIDVICDASELPFEDGCLDEIFSSHLIEHFTEFELMRKILPHWKSKLKVGGNLRIVMPDAVSMINDYVHGNMPFDDLKKVTFGAQDYEGDFHYNMFSMESLTELLMKSGFHDVEIVESNRKNGLCREMEALARK